MTLEWSLNELQVPSKVPRLVFKQMYVQANVPRLVFKLIAVS